jgi:hypothetical protein
MKYFSCTCLSTVWGVASEVTCRFLPMSCRSYWRSLFTASKAHLQSLVAIISNLTFPVFLWKYSACFLTPGKSLSLCGGFKRVLETIYNPRPVPQKTLLARVIRPEVKALFRVWHVCDWHWICWDDAAQSGVSGQAAYRELFKHHLSENSITEIREATNKAWVLVLFCRAPFHCARQSRIRQ